MAAPTKSTAILTAAALSLVITPAFARGGHGGGGHSSGGAHFGGGGHVSTPHYSAPAGHYSAPHYSAPHYSAPSYRGPVGGFHGAAPLRAPGVGYGHGYIAGGRGAYVVGGRVPAFYGHRGGLWYGPRYGWRVPLYWGGYYRPYPAYWGVGYWVTDWIMLDYIASEEARLRAYGGAVVVPVQTTPIDGGVREELRAQIAEILSMPETQGGAATPSAGNTLVVNDPRVARALAAPHHVFVVSQPVAVVDRGSGAACNLTPADLVRTSSPVPSGQATADVFVAASKTSSCAPGTTVAMPVFELVRFEEGLLARVARGAAAAKSAESEPEAAATAPEPDAVPIPTDGAALPPTNAPSTTAPAPHDLSTPTPSTTTLPGAMSL